MEQKQAWIYSFTIITVVWIVALLVAVANVESVDKKHEETAIREAVCQVQHGKLIWNHNKTWVCQIGDTTRTILIIYD
jgi:Na+/melibiose symporter-like transporter